MSIFVSSIVRQADIYSYSVTVTFTAGGLTTAFVMDDDDDDDDGDAFEY
jgi:hypothetical protein